MDKLKISFTEMSGVGAQCWTSAWRDGTLKETLGILGDRELSFTWITLRAAVVQLRRGVIATPRRHVTVLTHSFSVLLDLLRNPRHYLNLK